MYTVSLSTSKLNASVVGDHSIPSAAETQQRHANRGARFPRGPRWVPADIALRPERCSPGIGSREVWRKRPDAPQRPVSPVGELGASTVTVRVLCGRRSRGSGLTASDPALDLLQSRAGALSAPSSGWFPSCGPEPALQYVGNRQMPRWRLQGFYNSCDFKGHLNFKSLFWRSSVLKGTKVYCFPTVARFRCKSVSHLQKTVIIWAPPLPLRDF